MSLQSLSLINLAWALNLLALFFCVAGGWLLVATRLREQSATVAGSNAADGSLQTMQVEAGGVDAGKAAALNRFFYLFGGLTLAFGLALSMGSRFIQ
jgi:hypothetical protein